jgi:hypothetical protein
MLHCLLPPAWVPALQTPSMSPDEEPQGATKGRPGRLRDACTPGSVATCRRPHGRKPATAR